MEDGPAIWRVAGNILNKQSWTADKGWSSTTWVLGEVLPIPYRENWFCYETNLFGICGHGLDRSGSGKGQVAGTCECGNELSSSITCGEFLD